jgi:hypothetical protein
MVNIRTSEMDAKLPPVNEGLYNLYADRSSEYEQLLMRQHLRGKKKYEHGEHLKCSILIFIMEITHESLHLV